jgi:hypothetical protein
MSLMDAAITTVNLSFFKTLRVLRVLKLVGRVKARPPPPQPQSHAAHLPRPPRPKPDAALARAPRERVHARPNGQRHRLSHRPGRPGSLAP